MAHTLSAEKPEHAAAIEAVLDRAFGPGRFAKSSERVRERGAVAMPSLSRVALDEAGAVLGVCRIWRVEAGAPIFFLGPLAVDPSAQSAGLGADLVRAAVAACRATGGNGVVAIGAARFFEPFGFKVAPRDTIQMPSPTDPARLLWLELRPGGLANVAGQIKGPARL